ncbi:hypothetical protein [Natronolimnobius baerhuensis]|uniref:Uncharacterized protein n=1 Tax=Natronolimnobius baerhuensis TaxID=253108 RepID=A0A202EBW6_9EURY|nr:hypothetical protein [Natronolimnobius baerhuensis]OVE85746.1 hypothetical protein B2G88_02715 [Natronolimnobius baerhuensis]
MSPPDETQRTPLSDMDDAELYTVVRRATRDAIFDVVGTLALLGFSLVSLWIGVQTVIEQGTEGAIFAAPFVLLALYCGAAAFNRAPLPSIPFAPAEDGTGRY